MPNALFDAQVTKACYYKLMKSQQILTSHWFEKAVAITCCCNGIRKKYSVNIEFPTLTATHGCFSDIQALLKKS